MMKLGSEVGVASCCGCRGLYMMDALRVQGGIEYEEQFRNPDDLELSAQDMCSYDLRMSTN